MPRNMSKIEVIGDTVVEAGQGGNKTLPFVHDKFDIMRQRETYGMFSCNLA